jgi:hypothetical protein
MKFKEIRFFCIVCFFALILFSCKKNTDSPVDLGYGYYPSNIGHWVLYDVDSTYYSGYYHTVTTSHFLIKEYFESTYNDNEGRPTQRIERYKKIDTLPYFLKDVWASNLTQSTAEKVEENVRFVKLVFPIVEDKQWNGNAYNTKDPQDYTYYHVFMPYTVNGVTFDSTVTVIQASDTTNLVEPTNEFEVYAKHVGLIYKRFMDVKKLPPYLDSITSGVDYTMKIITFGN